MAKRTYDTPTMSEYGTVGALTEQLDKIGSVTDGYTSSDNNLDGVVQPDS